jgi:AmmeMemoRadiSam system protein B
MISEYLQQVAPALKVPQAIIVPHAGYIYSGEIAASAYARLQSFFPLYVYLCF